MISTKFILTYFIILICGRKLLKLKYHVHNGDIVQIRHESRGFVLALLHLEAIP